MRTQLSEFDPNRSCDCGAGLTWADSGLLLPIGRPGRVAVETDYSQSADGVNQLVDRNTTKGPCHVVREHRVLSRPVMRSRQQRV